MDILRSLATFGSFFFGDEQHQGITRVLSTGFPLFSPLWEVQRLKRWRNRELPAAKLMAKVVREHVLSHLYKVLVKMVGGAASCLLYVTLFKPKKHYYTILHWWTSDPRWFFEVLCCLNKSVQRSCCAGFLWHAVVSRYENGCCFLSRPKKKTGVYGMKICWLSAWFFLRMQTMNQYELIWTNMNQ